ncbi:hypothetical protein HPB50_022859 [Hyalomma asiaticum]|uniref:Uncharacterized protein n=1 Tax=Hyalomma asiaticum TaxID=266040 RepID=A0ACB7SKF1_HYAAI|nr:hypothetical protein HPB50_022859 [Hyalomma asiaticum]
MWLGMVCYSPNFEEQRDKYEETMVGQLRLWAEHLQDKLWVMGDRLTYVDFLLYEALDWHYFFKNDQETTELDLLEQQARDMFLTIPYQAINVPGRHGGLEWYAENMGCVLEPWDKHLSDREWALGDRLTYVDFMLYEGFDWHREFKPDALVRYPGITEYMKRFEELPNIKEYFASDKEEIMTPVLGYWDLRCLGQPIRNLLVYKGIDFVDKRYKFGPAPDYDCGEWLREKYTLGLRFPNLPYYIDEDVRLTQSLAILRYLARKHDLAAKDDKEMVELDVLEQQARDLVLILGYAARPQPRYKEGLKSYAENIKDMLEPWSRYLTSRKWALGDRLTYVDFILYEGLDWHREFKPEALAKYPPLVEYLGRFEELPNLKEYFASDNYKKWPITGPMRPWGYKK